MNQLLSTLRLSAILLAMLGTAAYATPGTITPEQDDTVQQEQNGDDGFIEEDDQDQNQDDQDQNQNDQGQDQDDGYQDDQGQNQDDNWGDDQGDDQYDRGQGDDQYDRGQGDDRNDKGQKDDGYDRPGKPGRDQGKNQPRRERRPHRLVENVPVRQQFFGGARFPLQMLVNNLQRFQGYRLVNVVINGSSDGGMGMAVFCASQCGPMLNVGYYINSYPLRTTGERVNRYSNQWFLELRGNFWVDSIQLEFVR